MKKLLLLLLLTTSFSAFALTLAPLVPCVTPLDIEVIAKFEAITTHHNEVTIAKKWTLNKQLEELKIENENLSDRGLNRNDFAKRRIEIIQLTKDIKQQIQILDSEPYPISNSQLDEFNRLKRYLGKVDITFCKKSPEGSLINGVREGMWTWYDNFNGKKKQGKYINGKKEGQWTEWLGTGYAYDTIEMNYKNDELDGKWVHWYSSEHPYTSHQRNEREMNTRYEISRLRTYLKSKELEIAYEEIIAQRELREKDTEKLEDEYKKLEIHIKNKEKLLFNLELLGEFPRILAEGNYINGKKEGVWTIFNRDFVRINKEEIYKDGVLIEK
jgi:antitoxin component YwqK of YwqJK toxin-antitoxin module